jgi:glycosyltransferase involved in cell wall biosynthesis
MKTVGPVDEAVEITPSAQQSSPITARYRDRKTSERSRLHILSVSTSDAGGGAERIGTNLTQAFAERGHDSLLAVGYKVSDNHNAPVVKIPNEDVHGRWNDFWLKMHEGMDHFRGRLPAIGRVRHHVRDIAGMDKTLPARLGLEDMNFPASRSLLDLAPFRPDLLLCHNLHGSYFDLRTLRDLSRQMPVVLDLHDMWTMTGHCAYTLGCDRWKTGCGKCPDLTIYPSIKKDATAYNWRRKRSIYADSALYITTPSQWLMDNVEESMLADGIVEARVIHNGVDRSEFHRGDMVASRAQLGIPQDARVLLFVANGVKQNIFKDYDTLRKAVEQVARQRSAGQEKIIFIALGSDEETQILGNVEIHHIPYQSDTSLVAQYYRAADIYLHAAKDDNFPNTVLEALASGTPVIATAVGGIPEQIIGCGGVAGGDARLNRESVERATGVLVAPGESDGMAAAIIDLLDDPMRLRQLSDNAAEDAAIRFDMETQVDALLDWFDEILEDSAESGRGV